MLKSVITHPSYARDEAAQMIERWLKEGFSSDEGICYYRHPSVITNTGVIPDFTLFTKGNQPLVIKTVPYQLEEISEADREMWIIDDISYDSPLLELEDLVIKLESKFLDRRELRSFLRPLAACRRERTGSHASRSTNACVIHDTGTCARTACGRKRNRVSDSDRTNWKDAPLPTLRSG
ncbi:MAG: hypothetical protein NVSMB38_40790 [Ktedonobacteraceae bacterium]